jgi:outer membrane protein OmpA-like peptidoglycan-associated protein
MPSGAVGATGPTGATGPQGNVGATGAQGIVGAVHVWTLVRDIRFDYNQAYLNDSEMQKVREIAQYLRENPSLTLAIDGTMDPRGTDPRNQDLNNRRVMAVSNALIQAGVSSSKIVTGAYGDKRLLQDRRVAVLARSDS